MHVHGEDAAGGGARVVEAQVQRAKPQIAPQLAAVHDVAADAVGAAQQRLGAMHVASGQRLSDRRTGHPRAVHLVAHHAGDIEAFAAAGRIQHGVVAGPFGAEAEVVTHQHVARLQAPYQHVADESLRRHGGEAFVEAHNHCVVDAAAFQFGQLVAQRRHARRCSEWLARQAREVVARVRLEGQHAGRHAAVPCFVDQQRQHGLVATVHAVEIADGHGRGW